MLPRELVAGIDQLLHGVPMKQVTRAAETLSAHYRGGGKRSGNAIRSEVDPLAYLVSRLPATYAAVAAALEETLDRRPGWQPATILDIGAGPGTAMWAAAQLWPAIESFTLVEKDVRMIEIGRRLAADSSVPAIRSVRWLLLDLTSRPDLPDSDLVVAAYSLGEFPSARLNEVVAHLWGACQDTLVVIEPGTPRGFATVRTVRDLLRAEEAWTLAPCPHDEACPMANGRWCHFAARLERSRQHRAAKRATLAYEDEKYAYVAMSRTAGSPINARVIGHPRTRHGRIDLDLCTEQGLKLEMVSRRDRERYRTAQRARWGTAIVEVDAEAGEDPSPLD